MRGLGQTCNSCSVAQRTFLVKAEARLMRLMAATSTFSQVCFHLTFMNIRRPCVHWPGHHQWIHYDPEQKSYSPLKERSQYEGEKVDFMSHREDWFVNDHLEE